MICPSDDLSTIPQVNRPRYTNWYRLLNLTATKAYFPGTRAEIVEIIRSAEEAGESVKAMGSRWSFAPVMSTRDNLVNMDRICGVIPPNLVLSQLPLHDNARAMLDDNMLVHVRGGTKICKINRILHGLDDGTCDGNGGLGSCGAADETDLDLVCDGSTVTSRAIETLGGSGGQSIAGVISTGVHGGDIQLPPIADFVMAIHLIGPGGQEWWVERATGETLTEGSETSVQRVLRSVGDDEFSAVEICRHVRVKKDDDYFNALMVSVGRMGIIYSLVMRTAEGFKLREARAANNWATLRTSLRPRAINDFMRPFGTRGSLPHFFNVMINPFPENGTINCVITSRNKVARPCTAANVNMENNVEAGTYIQQIFCSQTNLTSVVAGLVGVLRGISAALVPAGGLGGIFAGLLDFFIGPIALLAGITFSVSTAAAKVAIEAVIAYLVTATGSSPVQLIGRVGRDLYRIGLGQQFRDMMTALFNSAYPSDQTRTGVSWKIMDTYNYNVEDYCTRVRAMEFAFDVDFTSETRNYIAFIDEVLSLYDEFHTRNIPVAGLFSLRYTANTAALIGMSQFRRTCHIEMPFLQSFQGNDEMIARVQNAALRHGGIPHWGQEMSSVSRSDIAGIYGEKLTTWRRVLRDLIEEGGGNQRTFSNTFTRKYNLEPGYADSPELRTCLTNLLD